MGAVDPANRAVARGYVGRPWPTRLPDPLGPAPAGPVPPPPPVTATGAATNPPLPPSGPGPHPADFPEPSTPGRSPTPLPLRSSQNIEFRLADWEALTDDPGVGVGLDDAEPIRTQMSAAPPSGWSAASELTLTAPSRTAHRDAMIPDQELMVLDDGRFLLFDEPPMRFEARRIRRHSLDPPPPGTPLLSHLRALHVRTVPGGRVALGASWQPVSGIEGVLDTFSSGEGGPTTCFQLSAVLGDHDGLVVSGAAPGRPCPGPGRARDPTGRFDRGGWTRGVGLRVAVSGRLEGQGDIAVLEAHDHSLRRTRGVLGGRG